MRTSISRTILEGGTSHDSYEVIADLTVICHAASGDGWHEPREPLHGEAYVAKLTLHRRGAINEVECPRWLAALIVEDAQEEADEAARDHLCEEVA